MSITAFIAQETLVDAASGAIVVEKGQVIDLDHLYAVCVRIQGRGVPPGEVWFPNRLFQRLAFPTRRAYAAATRLEASGRRYTNQPGEPVCLIAARAIELAAGGFELQLHGRDEIYDTTGRPRQSGELTGLGC